MSNREALRQESDEPAGSVWAELWSLDRPGESPLSLVWTARAVWWGAWVGLAAAVVFGVAFFVTLALTPSDPQKGIGYVLLPFLSLFFGGGVGAMTAGGVTMRRGEWVVVGLNGIVIVTGFWCAVLSVWFVVAETIELLNTGR